MTADQKRWLTVLCLGYLVIVFGGPVVNVALPSIRVDLGLSGTALTWVINIYILTFGGFLLLAGRMGDLFGHRRLFLIGLTVFIAASLACGLAGSPAALIGARAVQGIGAAIIAVVALSLVMIMFPEPAERAKAMGVMGFMIAGDGAVGVLLGGVLTDVLNWRWVFLVSIPIGVVVIALCVVMLPARPAQQTMRRLDVAGAVTVTLALLIAVYAITDANRAGWASMQTITLLLVAAAMLAVFLGIEVRAESPLMPLGLFRLRSVATANIVGVLLAAAMLAWYFLSALYLQFVLGYSPLQVGLAFLPANLIMGVFSLGFSERLVLRFGFRAPLATGMLLVTVSLALFARTPVTGNYTLDMLPGMILLGLGTGMGFSPVLLAAMSEVDPSEAGLASGVANTSLMMGGALGLAVLVSLAEARISDLTDSGADRLTALTGGYHAAFLVGAACAATAAVLAALLLRSRALQPPLKRRTS